MSFAQAWNNLRGDVDALKRGDGSGDPPQRLPKPGELVPVRITANADGGGIYVGEFLIGSPDVVRTTEADLGATAGFEGSAECLIVNAEENGLPTHWLKVDDYAIGKVVGVENDEDGKPVVLLDGGYYRVALDQLFGLDASNADYKWQRDDVEDAPTKLYGDGPVTVVLANDLSVTDNLDGTATFVWAKRTAKYDAGGRLFEITTGAAAAAESVTLNIGGGTGYLYSGDDWIDVDNGTLEISHNVAQAKLTDVNPIGAFTGSYDGETLTLTITPHETGFDTKGHYASDQNAADEEVAVTIGYVQTLGGGGAGGGQFYQWRIKVDKDAISGDVQTVDGTDWRGRPFRYALWSATENSDNAVSAPDSGDVLAGPSNNTEMAAFGADELDFVIDGTDGGKLKAKLNQDAGATDKYFMLVIWAARKETTLETGDINIT
jgi:hypothetical protein